MWYFVTANLISPAICFRFQIWGKYSSLRVLTKTCASLASGRREVEFLKMFSLAKICYHFPKSFTSLWNFISRPWSGAAVGTQLIATALATSLGELSVCHQHNHQHPHCHCHQYQDHRDLTRHCAQVSSVREEQLVCDNSDSQGEEDFAIRFGILLFFGPHDI